MNYLPQILFSFGAIGVINSLIVSVYFLISKTYSSLNNRLFGLFLLVLSLRVLKSIFYAFSTADSIWYINAGPTFFLLIGPLLFSYLFSSLRPESVWVKHYRYHILFWCFVMIVLMILFPFATNVQLNKKIILPIINVQWLIYILLSAVLLIASFRNKKSMAFQYKWYFLFISVNLVIWTSFALIDFEYFVSGSIIFSVIFYFLFAYFLFNKKFFEKIFKRTKIKKATSFSGESEMLIQRLNDLVTTEKLYVNPNLKIADLASNLNVSTHELSKLINEYLGKSFNEFINEYRIEEAKKLIATNTNYTVEAIGNLSGFNSKSAFYKAFKAYTDTTPAKYQTLL